MKEKMINEVIVQGWLYSAKLKEKVSGENSKNPGTPFINGEISIAVDKECTNVITTHFSYVTPTYTKSGKPNPNYVVLKAIITGMIGTVMGAEKTPAAIVKVDGSMGLNDFFTTDKQSGEEVAVASKRIEASFIRVIEENELPPSEIARASFKFDFLINGTRMKPENEEFNSPEKLIVKGAVFDFRKSILPIELSVLDSGAINYFEGLEASPRNPVFTEVRGYIVSKVATKETKEIGAWGNVSVKSVPITNKDYVIDWARPDVYPEELMTAEDIEKAMQDRNLYLANVKKSQEERMANSKIETTVPGAFAAPKHKEYNF